MVNIYNYTNPTRCEGEILLQPEGAEVNRDFTLDRKVEEQQFLSHDQVSIVLISI